MTDNQLYRGLLQTNDGVITEVLESGENYLIFNAFFNLSSRLVDKLEAFPEHLIFSERSRIARIGVQITSETPKAEALEKGGIALRLKAWQAIKGYPALTMLKDFFSEGLPVGRLVFCDPGALLSSDEVLEAIDRAELKLPASTTVSSDGSIVIAPHRVVCTLRDDLDIKTLGRILLRRDGREILNRYQIRNEVKALKIPAGEGVISTCSMYLNDHYVVLQSGFELGEHLSATILDPIKTRGIRIYLEIVNNSDHPIVNPLILAKIYRAPNHQKKKQWFYPSKGGIPYGYDQIREVEKMMHSLKNSTCHFVHRPVAIMPCGEKAEQVKVSIFSNGPEIACKVPNASCTAGRRDFSPSSMCPHVYATSKISEVADRSGSALVLKYFPSMMEHRDIINLAYEGKICALYFIEPSCEHGPFLSQLDHTRLLEYHAFGLDVFWASSLNDCLMVHTIRDGKGYFVDPRRFADFHKSMLFAFYGSNKSLSDAGNRRLGELLDALVDFWGQNIGIVTGGGSGVMEQVNQFARDRGILSGANFLNITDQSMTREVDFCQVFQDTCRHSRQKWFEIASFPIFNVGGLGSLEELGITLCNMKLSILEPVPVILFDTEGDGTFWENITRQICEMVRYHRAPPWILNNIVITNNPCEVIEAYRNRLQLF
ncbi:MAG: LOG family protein [Desulfobacterales bacterium]